jgi:LysM repeat protein
VSKSDTFTATSDGSGISSWKLTLRGSDSIDPMKTSGNTNLQTGYTVETLTITHGAADNLTGATQVSAMLTDSNGTVLYYGKINDDIDETSSNVTIPEGLPAGSYSLYVFAETVNGATETDYASALGDQITITVTGPPAVTYHTITTVASPTNGGTASGGGQVADGGSTTLIANPNSGYNFAKWTLSGNQVSTSSSYPISNITADATYTAVFEKKSDFSQNESSGEEQLSSDNTKDAYVNPLVWNYMADNSNSLCLIEKQGPACVTAFKAATPASYAEAFSFNLLLKDSGLFKPTFVKKTGKFVLNIPKEWQKRGRTFALIGIDKNGKTRIFTDKDFSDETITTTLDIEGYAFSLIYTDLVGTEQKANKPSVGTSGVYTVQEGDTLSEVAQKLGKTRKYLKEANNLKNPDKLSVGQKLHY